MENRVAIITGAANGIGRMVAEQLSKEGCHVALLDKDLEDLRLENNFLGFKVDVTNDAEVKQVIQNVINQFGKVDILVNTVGGTLHSKEIEDINDSDWDSTFELNLRHVFNCTRAVVPIMKSNGWGRIVNISAVAGRTFTFFGGVDFTAAKAALIGFTRQCAFELAPYGITVNAVAPGLTLTERVESMWGLYDETKRGSILDRIPIGRPATMEEQSSTICFLCSEHSSYICGATIDVNGGMFIG